MVCYFLLMLVNAGSLCGGLVQGHPELGLGRALRFAQGAGERLHGRDLRSGVHQPKRTPPIGQDRRGFKGVSNVSVSVSVLALGGMPFLR